jgi:hypothetical protein
MSVMAKQIIFSIFTLVISEDIGGYNLPEKRKLKARWDFPIIPYYEYYEKQKEMIKSWEKPMIYLLVISLISFFVYFLFFRIIYIVFFGLFVFAVLAVGWPMVRYERRRLERDDYIHTQAYWNGPEISFKQVKDALQEFLATNKMNYTLRKDQSYYIEFFIESKDIELDAGKTQPAKRRLPSFKPSATGYSSGSYFSLFRILYRPSNFLQAQDIQYDLDEFLTSKNLLELKKGKK